MGRPAGGTGHGWGCNGTTACWGNDLVCIHGVCCVTFGGSGSLFSVFYQTVAAPFTSFCIGQYSGCSHCRHNRPVPWQGI